MWKPLLIWKQQGFLDNGCSPGSPTMVCRGTPLADTVKSSPLFTAPWSMTLWPRTERRWYTKGHRATNLPEPEAFIGNLADEPEGRTNHQPKWDRITTTLCMAHCQDKLISSDSFFKNVTTCEVSQGSCDVLPSRILTRTRWLNILRWWSHSISVWDGMCDTGSKAVVCAGRSLIMVRWLAVRLWQASLYLRVPWRCAQQVATIHQYLCFTWKPICNKLLASYSIPRISFCLEQNSIWWIIVRQHARLHASEWMFEARGSMAIKKWFRGKLSTVQGGNWIFIWAQIWIAVANSVQVIPKSSCRNGWSSGCHYKCFMQSRP